jgi:hypothetical protein
MLPHSYLRPHTTSFIYFNTHQLRYTPICVCTGALPSSAPFGCYVGIYLALTCIICELNCYPWDQIHPMCTFLWCSRIIKVLEPSLSPGKGLHHQRSSSLCDKVPKPKPHPSTSGKSSKPSSESETETNVS